MNEQAIMPGTGRRPNVLRPAAAILLLAVASVSASGRTAEGDDPGQQAFAAASHAVDRAVTALRHDIRRGDEADVRAAREAIREMARVYFDELLAQLDPNAVEKTLRIRKLLSALPRRLAERRLLAGMAPGERRRAKRLGKEEPALFAELIGEDPAAAAEALTELAYEHTDDVEPIVRWGIRSRHRRIRQAALDVAGALDPPGDRLQDVLVRHLERIMPEGADERPWRDQYGWYLRQRRRQERQSTLEALASAGAKGALPRAFRALVRGEPLFHRAAAARLIVALADRRVVRTLMQVIESGTVGRGMPLQDEAEDGTRLTCKAMDFALYALLRCTGQRPSAYGLRRTKPPDRHETIMGGKPAPVGFADEATRRAAYERLQGWWKEHASQYQQLEPIDWAAE